MKVALVHDYLNEFGGAERVLQALAEMYPEAPIYTAYYKKDSPAYEKFSDREIYPSFAQKIPGFVSKLHSPLRFMAPLIWESFNLDEYDVVISSSSWYITKGVITRPETLHVSYLHTPPRYLYGYPTAVEWQKYPPVRMYANWVNKGLRKYDYLSAKRVDVMVANSENVKGRIRKYYDMDSVVIYPPVDIRSQKSVVSSLGKGYFLTGGRLTGGKNFDLAVKAAVQMGIEMKVFGEGRLRESLEAMGEGKVEFVGRVDEQQLADLYAGAKAFIALAKDEDFGITPVEAMAAGTPVIAYRGGGYVETVVDGKTGVLIDDLSVNRVMEGMRKLQETSYKKQDIVAQAKKFSKQRYKKEMGDLVNTEYKKHRKLYDVE